MSHPRRPRGLRPLTSAPRAPTATDEERTGALIKRAAPPGGLDREGLDRVWKRITRGPASDRRDRLVWSLKWALVAMVLMASGAVVGAQTGVWTWPRVMMQRLTGRATPISTDVGVGRTHTPVRRIVASQAPVPTAVAAAVTVAAADLREATPMAPAGPNAGPRRVPGDATLAKESLLLSRVLGRLRHQGDPAVALAELDAYSTRFPAGLLGPEAERARVDALLMAGRLAEARTTLSALTLGTGARDRELRLIRAELNAQTACAAALTDYDAVLSDVPSGALAERALWGKAACHDRLGDESRASAALAAYLARFPAGPHSALARARLRN